MDQGLNAITHVANLDLPRGISDEVWAKAAGESGWITLSKDLETRYKPNEREAIVRYKARVVQFTRGNWTSDQMIAAFTEAKKRIGCYLTGSRGPLSLGLTRKAK